MAFFSGHPYKFGRGKCTSGSGVNGFTVVLLENGFFNSEIRLPDVLSDFPSMSDAGLLSSI